MKHCNFCCDGCDYVENSFLQEGWIKPEIAEKILDLLCRIKEGEREGIFCEILKLGEEIEKSFGSEYKYLPKKIKEKIDWLTIPF